jgi:hypothetical protein
MDLRHYDFILSSILPIYGILKKWANSVVSFYYGLDCIGVLNSVPTNLIKPNQKRLQGLYEDPAYRC